MALAYQQHEKQTALPGSQIESRQHQDLPSKSKSFRHVARMRAYSIRATPPPFFPFLEHLTPPRQGLGLFVCLNRHNTTLHAGQQR